MRRRVSFYPDGGGIEDVTDQPTAWSDGSDYQGVIDDEELWQEYIAKKKALAEVERRVFKMMQVAAPFTDAERIAHDEAEAKRWAELAREAADTRD